MTEEDLQEALDRVENGESGIDDANLLRAYIAGLKARLEYAERDCACDEGLW